MPNVRCARTRPSSFFGKLVRQSDRVPFDDDVDVEVRLAEQNVAHRAADEVHAVIRVADGRDRVQHRREAVGKLEVSPRRNSASPHGLHRHRFGSVP